MAQDQIVVNWLQINLAGNKKCVCVLGGFPPPQRSGIPEGEKWQETELLLLGAVRWACL